MSRDFFTAGPGHFGYTWVKATDVDPNKTLDEVFKEIYQQATKERLERGYIVDDLKKYNAPEYGVTQPEDI